MNCGPSCTSFCWSDLAGFGWASTRSVSGECHNGGPGDKLEKISAPDCKHGMRSLAFAQILISSVLLWNKRSEEPESFTCKE